MAADTLNIIPTQLAFPYSLDSGKLTPAINVDLKLTAETPAGEEVIPVQIPDFFKSIMATEVAVSPFYESVKATGYAWASKIFGSSEELSRRLRAVDSPLLAASMIPNATEEQVLAFTAWHYWVTSFDDRVDDGDVRDDIIRATEEILETLAVLDHDCPTVDPERYPVRHIFQAAWRSFCSSTTKEAQIRYKKRHRVYMMGLIEQVRCLADNEKLTVEKYIALRRANVGTSPVFSIVEWVNDINLPCHIVDHPYLDIFRDLSTDMVWLVNDIVSVQSELATDTNPNLISVLLRQGSTIQEAIDELGRMLDDCYDLWGKTLQKLPEQGWDEDTNRQVLKLIEGYRVAHLGTAHWSFETRRYFRDKRAQVRATRIINISAKDVERHQRL